MYFAYCNSGVVEAFLLMRSTVAESSLLMLSSEREGRKGLNPMAKRSKEAFDTNSPEEYSGHGAHILIDNWA